MRIKYFAILLICLFFFFYGFISHRNHIFPYQLFKSAKDLIKPEFNIDEHENRVKEKFINWNSKNPNFNEISVKKYFPGINIFTDRHYFNHLNNNKLSDFNFVQIPRHYQKSIKLDVKKNIKIYRILCKRNDNLIYENWQKEDYLVAIIGEGCVHEIVISKEFKKGKINLPVGGPNSSDPIFFKNNVSVNIINN